MVAISFVVACKELKISNNVNYNVSKDSPIESAELGS